MVTRVRYVCYGKTRKQTDCDGQTGYTTHILDDIVDQLMKTIFEKMKAIPKSEIVNTRYGEKMKERKALLAAARADYTKAADDLGALKAEVVKSLRGESHFSPEILNSIIANAETECNRLKQHFEEAQAAYNEGQELLKSLNAQYDDVIKWSEMYEGASIEAKKMVIGHLISRIEVYRDYKLHIDFNIDFNQFSLGIDFSNLAA